MRPRRLVFVYVISLHVLVLVSLRPMIHVAVMPDFNEQTDPSEMQMPSLMSMTSVNQHATTESAKTTAGKAVPAYRKSTAVAEEKQIFGCIVDRCFWVQ